MFKPLAFLVQLALLIVATSSSSAVSRAESPPLQRCTIEAELVGNPYFFATYSSDSWQGPVAVTCWTPGQPDTRDMFASFNSSITGYGVLLTSKITIKINVTTTIPLKHLRLQLRLLPYAPLTRPVVGGYFYEVNSENIQARVEISSGDANYLKSISDGTLLIR